MKTMRRITLLCVCLSAFLSGCPEPAPMSRSIRLMVYNVKFVPDGDDVNDVVFADDKARATYIAARINAQLAEIDADVIVFNEAFDVDAQRALSAGLCGAYPYFSRFIDEEDDDQHQDSGLMILSRHPFAMLHLTVPDYEAKDHLTFTQCVGEDADEDHPAYWDDIGFQLFLNCNFVFEDCSSNKGIAAARFTHNGTGELFNVLFTHLQSGGDPDQIETRVKQMTDVRELVEAIPGWETQRTFIVGDLNIKGIGCSGAGCVSGADGSEWGPQFDSAGGFFSCGDGPCDQSSVFVESHGFEMPDTDFGRTFHGDQTSFGNPLGGNRYDYVLHNVPQERWTCMQHFEILREAVLDPDGTPVSDHYPIVADFNWRADHCNPLNAALVVANDVFLHDGRITYPKSVQWLLIQDAGTYTIVTPPKIRFEVYASTDLSDPVGADPEEFFPRGITYRLPEPPYYVKLEATDPTYTGTYIAQVIRHACGEQDPCGLTPGDVEGHDANWLTSAVGTSSRWFFFDTDVGEQGDSPEIDIHIEGVCNSPGFEAFLYNDVNAVAWTSVDPGNVPTTLTASADALAPGRYRVEVHRTDNGGQPPCWMKVQYFTTLTYVDFDILRCIDETGGAGGPGEEIGHDEIWYRLGVDKVCRSTNDHTLFSFARDFDEDDAKTFNFGNKVGLRRYTGCWWLELLEEDDISDGDVTHLATDKIVLSLHVESRTAHGKLSWNSGDYEYELGYDLSHEPDPK